MPDQPTMLNLDVDSAQILASGAAAFLGGLWLTLRGRRSAEGSGPTRDVGAEQFPLPLPLEELESQTRLVYDRVVSVEALCLRMEARLDAINSQLVRVEDRTRNLG